ncbi:MAG: glycosyltransferase [Chloroflexota bacterium]
MKILVLSTPIMQLPPPGYSGLEWLVAQWSRRFANAGHEVSVVAPEGSNLGPDIEIIAIPPGQQEEAAFVVYRERLQSGEFDVVLDSTWQWWSVIAQMDSSKQLPVIHIWHSDYNGVTTPPPIQYPCLVGLSKDHAMGIARRTGWPVKRVYNGIDLDFYTYDPSVERGDRYLWLARYTPEKAPMEAISLARKCRIALDMYGDTSIVQPPDYPLRVQGLCDSHQIVFHPGVPREQTRDLYRSHKALIHLVNYQEAFGLAVVEAMACGMPVICNRMGALPELVRHGKTGFVVDTWEEAEDIIRQDLVSNIDPMDCQRQAKKFGIEKSTQGYLKLFGEMVKGAYW